MYGQVSRVEYDQETTPKWTETQNTKSQNFA